MTVEAIQPVLAQMESEVRKANFEKAAQIGNAFEPPLAVSTTALHLGVVLHVGQQGSVVKGNWQGRPVAVKRARISTSADLERFRTEVKLLSELGSHKNVVCLVAARLLPPAYLLVMPYIPFNLSDRLHLEGWKPSFMEVLKIGKEVATGLAHIHACGVLHRDIKPANILIDEEGAVAICDFGIAEKEATLAAEQADRQSLVGRQNPSGGFHKRHMVGTLEYLAPEVLLKQPYSFPSDVYAWAVSVNEMATGIVPFTDCTKDNPNAHTVLNFGYGRQELAAAIVSEGLRPLMEPGTPSELSNLFEECWQLDPQQRPSAAHLVSCLELALKSYHSQYSSSHTRVPKERDVSEFERQQARKRAAHDVDIAFKPEESRQSSVGDLQTPTWLQALVAADGLSEKVTSGSFETAGMRGADRMEDRHVIVSAKEPGSMEAADVHLFAVFDGHRGAEAADFAATFVERYLWDEWKSSSSACEALKNCFLRLDTAFCQQSERLWAEKIVRLGSTAGQRSWPGCTAITVLLVRGHLWVANAGDCRAVLCREGKALQLNQEHSADLPQELQRIKAAGGKLQEMQGKWRIGEAGIQVTRSLGDADLKSSGLTAEPDVSEFRISPSDQFLVLASDGLWERLSSQEAVDLVHDTVKEATMCAKRLATEALARGSGDNITVIVTFLQPVETLEKIFAAGQQKYRSAVPTAKQKGAPAAADEIRDTY